MASLRKYVMTYINTVIESNDEKLEAQEKYLQALEKRVAQLSKLDEFFAHQRFEKTVKLQESSRKSKNFTAGAPSVHGDQQSYEVDILPPSTPEPTPPHQIFFTSKSFKESPVLANGEQGGKEMALLVLRSAQLQ